MQEIMGASMNKEWPPPTFGPISCIGSKFTRMSAHLGVSFAWLIRAHSWSVEKHSIKRYSYLRVRKLGVSLCWWMASRRSQLMDRTLTTPNSTVAFCCSELESSTSTAPFYIIACPTLQRICERYKSAYPLFGRLVRCSAHGCSYARLWYMQKCIRIEE